MAAAAGAIAPPASINSAIDGATMTPLHWRIWLLASLGGLLDAFDLFIIGVALPLIERDFSPSIVELGLIGAASPLGAILGASVAGRLADRIGRKKIFAIDLAMFVVCTVLSAFSPAVLWLIAFRFLLGIAVGADYPISSSYVAEFMPAKVRGRMMVGALSFQAIGSVIGAVVGLVVLLVIDGDVAWRVMLAMGVIPALVVIALRQNSPESPRWAQEHGMGEEAAAITARLTGGTGDSVVATSSGEPDLGPAALFTPRFLRRTILAVFPWFLMDIALYGIGLFTPTILAVLNIGGETDTLNPSFISRDVHSTEGAVLLDLFLVVGFVLAILLIDRVGRLTLQMVGFAGMTAGLLLVAFASNGTEQPILIVIGFAIFNVLVNMGPNSTTWTLPTELFPTNIRCAASGLAAAAGKAGAAVGIFMLPILQRAWGLSTLMVAIALVCALGFIITLTAGSGLETAGQALEG